MTTPQAPSDSGDPLARALEIHRRLQAEYAQDFMAVPMTLSVALPGGGAAAGGEDEPAGEDES